MAQVLDFKSDIDYSKLKEVANIIKTGELVVFPTDTVYGIGANGFDEQAIKKLYEVKKRPLDNRINLLVSDIHMIEQVAENISELEYALIKEFLPGPLTIILKKKQIVPNILTANTDTVGVRIPANEIALKLIEYAGVPLATPSANISGAPSGTSIDKIVEDFNGKVDYFIDDGPSKIGVASTIVRVIDNVPHILRQGYISEEQINNVARKLYN